MPDLSSYNEQQRLDALRSYHILDTLEEQDFDDLTALAATICQVPIALVSLVDKERQWFKSHYGLAATETPIETSFCAHAIVSTKDILVVEDAHLDERFKNNPLVTGDPYISFYAGVPLVNEDGFTLGTLCVIDRSTRNLTEEQLRALKIIARQVMDKLELRRKNTLLNASEERTRKFIANAPVAIGVLAGRGLVIEQANDMILEVWGKTTAIIGQPLAEALPELQGQPFLGLLDEVYTTGEAYHGSEARVWLTRNGVPEECYFNFVYQPNLGTNGNTETITVIANEVTRQFVQRLQLVKSEQNLQLLADNMSQLAWMADETGYIFWYNSRWYEHTGTTLEEMKGSGWHTVHHPEHVERVVEKYNTDFAEGNIWEDLFPLRGKDGEYRWFLSRAVPLRDEHGTIIRWFGTNTDVTEQQEDQQRKSAFMGMVSHELKTPLTSLNGYLQILLDMAKKEGHPFRTNALEKSRSQAQKMTGIITGFLDASRYESGKVHIEAHPFNLAELINEVAEESRATITSHPFQFAAVPDLTLHGDRDKIGQVLHNLISNAVKYSTAGSTIDVRCDTNNGFAEVSVRDEGMGIKKEDQAHLFDRYYRVAGDHMRNISGFGIGLYICKEIIERHHGKIWVESEPGNGSVFAFSLPLDVV